MSRGFLFNNQYFTIPWFKKKQMQCNNAILLFVNSPGYNGEFVTYLLS